MIKLILEWYQKLLEIEKVREVARGDQHYLRKSADREAQISQAFVQLTGLICAFRSADFLRLGLSPQATSRNLFFYFQ